MINKLTPRKLNPSLDSRLRAKDEMLDAMNVSIKTDLQGESGDVGVLKPVMGTSGINFTPLNSAPVDTQRRVIGSVTDEKNDIIFYFLFSEYAPEMGVYAYDPTNKLTTTGGDTIKTVYRSAHFNFPQNGYVKGDVVYTTNHEVCNLYFTDNVNEPRRLDVYRAVNNTYSSAIDVKDFITACPKTPMHPIDFEFTYNSESSVSEFKNIPGFQFAYQCIYSGGEESAISTYSDIAVPPSYVQQGTINNPNLLAHNVCNLTIPKQVNGVDVYSEEIEKIRILGRISNLGAWYVIDEVDTTGSEILYAFSNDRVLTGVPDEDVQKQFTSLPRKAQAQTVIDNRLFYGNYIDSFDEPEVNASMTVYYRDRPTDFINLQLELEPIVLPNSLYTYGNDGINYNPSNPTPNRRAGYRMITDNMPDEISANSVMTVNLTVHPDRYFRFYNTESGISHHASKDLFGRPESSAGNIDEGLNSSGIRHLSGASSFFGYNDGVLDGMRWRPEDTSVIEVGEDGGVDVVCGTSASNPLSIQGRALNFSCTLRFNNIVSGNVKSVVRNAVCNALTGGPMDASEIGANVDVLSQSTYDSYSYNLGLNDESGIDEISVSSGDDFRKNLVNTVKLKSDDQLDDVPVGYFIINSADVAFSLNRYEAPQSMEGESDNGFLYLSLDSISNTSIKTCIPKISYNQYIGWEPRIDSYIVYSDEYIDQNVVDGSLSWDNVLKVVDGQASDQEDWNFFWHPYGWEGLSPVYNRTVAAGRLISFGDLVDSYSLIDGESGPSAKSYSSATALSSSLSGVDFEITYSNFSQAQGTVSFLVVFTGNHRPSFTAGGFQIDSYEGLFGTVHDFPVRNEFADMDGDEYGFSYKNVVDLTGDASKVEVIDFSSYLTDAGLVNYDRSFKTKANHDFGVVYYDERGRAGNVNKLPTVYVPGYSAEERGSRKGRVEIGVQLNHQPPPWAHHYQIVYAGNSSVSDFIQYTTGGAFVSNSEEGGDERNIYVSLNYLQQHPTVSYAKDFGAVSVEGGNDLYSFTPGDKLRIISYFVNDGDPTESRIWPKNYEFQIVDSVILTDDPDTNPIVTSEDLNEDPTGVPFEKTGRFLILRDNKFAVGFSHADVSAQSQTNTNVHQWNDRCVVEIYSPLDKQSSEDRVYYEIGKVYNVITSDEVKVHQTNPLILRNGDVWWRRVPVNMPDWNEGNNYFTNLITSQTSPSKFRDYYLETKTFNDTLPRANQFAWGKIKTVSPFKKEVRRESSITYSDKNNYASPLVRFTSFNPYKLQYKDLPAEYGAINYILNYSDSLFCIQEEKTSAIPVDRTLIADAAGAESLIASSRILGTQRFFAGGYGCDNNPESVVKVDNFVYFANKSKQEVYRYSPDTGVSVISDGGMRQYFRSIFLNTIADADESDAIGVRVVGGYDPLKDEFLISIFTVFNLIEPIPEFYEPPVQSVIDEVSDSVDISVFTEEAPDLTVSYNNITIAPTSSGFILTGSVSLTNLDDFVNIRVFPVPFDFDVSSSSYLDLIIASQDLTDIPPYSINNIFEDSSLVINTGGLYNPSPESSPFDSSTTYRVIITVDNGISILDYSEYVFNTTATEFVLEEEDPLYQLIVDDLSWNLGITGDSPTGFDIQYYISTNQDNVKLYSYLVPNVSSESELENYTLELNGSFYNAGYQLVTLNGAYNVAGNQGTDIQVGGIEDISYTNFAPQSLNSSQPHLLASFLVKDGFIQALAYTPISAYEPEVSLSLGPASYYYQEGGFFGSGIEVSDFGAEYLINQIQQYELENGPTGFNYQGYDPATDSNRDGIIGTVDLLTLLGAYGQSIQLAANSANLSNEFPAGLDELSDGEFP